MTTQILAKLDEGKALRGNADFPLSGCPEKAYLFSAVGDPVVDIRMVYSASGPAWPARSEGNHDFLLHAANTHAAREDALRVAVEALSNISVPVTHKGFVTQCDSHEANEALAEIARLLGASDE